MVRRHRGIVVLNKAIRVGRGRSQPIQRQQDPVQQRMRVRRTARHKYIHRNHLLYPAQRGVVPSEHTSSATAGADRKDEARLGSGFVRFTKRQFHIA